MGCTRRSMMLLAHYSAQGEGKSHRATEERNKVPFWRGRARKRGRNHRKAAPPAQARLFCWRSLKPQQKERGSQEDVAFPREGWWVQLKEGYWPFVPGQSFPIEPQNQR